MKTTKEDLYNLYVTENKTDKEIGEMYGVTFGTVYSWRKKYGIKGINAQHRRLVETPHVDLTQRQRSIILGSLLGDSCLKSNSKKSAYLSISHTEKQKDYVYWLYNELSSICVSAPKKYISKGKYFAYSINSESRKDLKDLRDMIYVPKKTLNNKWLDEVNELGVAVWFMDDGSLQYVNKSKSIFSFATNSFSIEEHYMLINMLNRFGVNSEIKTYNKKSGIQYNLIISDSSYSDFEALVNLYIIDSMRHKLPTLLWEDKLRNSVERKITKEGLENLYYNENLTQEQISIIYGVHKSTIRKYMNLFDVAPRDHASAQLHGKNNNGKRNRKGRFQEHPLSRDDEQKAIDLFKKIKANGFPYIDKKPVENYLGIIDSLCQSDLTVENGTYKYSSAAVGICSAYCPQIFSMASANSLSPLDIFHDGEMLMDSVRRTIKFAKRDTVASVRQGLKTYKKNRCVTIFPPMWAKTALQKVCANQQNLSLLDFSCGFAGRLIGSYASDVVSKYVGIDPVLENIQSHEKIYEIIQRHSALSGRSIDAEFIHSTAEEYLANSKCGFDVIMTSPPYFNKEIYSSNPSQCYMKYKTYDEWKEKWMRYVLQKSYDLLNPNGTIILFASNTDMYPVGDDCRDLLYDIAQNDVVRLDFAVVSLEYLRKKGVKKMDHAWVARKT